MQTRFQQQGYVLLLSVLVVGAIGSTIAVSLLLVGVGASRSSFSLQQSVQARWIANACAESALERLRLSSSYTGGETVELGEGECDIVVLGSGSSDRTVQATATVGGVVRKIEVVAATVDPTVSITSWQEVDNF